MSKVIKRAKERYWLEPNNIETQEKYAAYIEGYHQAEKDNELTWEDIRDILKIYDTFTREKGWVECKTLADGYQEILKRFKDLKK